MTDNPYAAPKAVIQINSLQENSRAFFSVSPRKLAIMFWSTLGLYQIYLFYKNWALQKQATGADVMPVMRGIFAIFFAHELYQRADACLTEHGEKHDWDINALATTFIILTIGSEVLERMTIGQPYAQLLGLGLVFWIFRVIAHAQVGLNLAAGDPQGATNQKLTSANYVWILAGALVWLLTVVGVLSQFWPDLLE